MKKLKCIIVDDDEIDRLTVCSFAKRFEHIDIVGSYSNAEDALAAIAANTIDILFLDIDMPVLSGVELRKKALEIPACVFITSHPEYAVESFELDTLDYIVKPLKYNRFAQTITRIDEFLEIKHKAQLFESSIGGDVIYIKQGHEQTKVKLHDIIYLEALKDYTLLITSKKRHCVLSSIGMLLKEEHFKSFIRIHRSFAVQKQFVDKINPHELLLNNGTVVPVGRSFKENINMLLL